MIPFNWHLFFTGVLLFLLMVIAKAPAEKFAVPHDVIEKLDVKTPVRIFTSDELKRYTGVDVSFLVFKFKKNVIICIVTFS